SIEWVIDEWNPQCLERMFSLNQFFIDSYVTIPVLKSTRWNDCLIPQLLEVYEEIHLAFGYHRDPGDSYLNCHEVHQLIKKLKARFPKHRFQPPKGVDLWDHRARDDFDMEPYLFPCFETRSLRPKPHFSVIIPTFNNQNHLRVVLRHLYQQNVGLDQFEVIVVDDGGTDQTLPLVMELLKTFDRSMNFKYIFFPRARKRVMGDSQYRAGISRNLGVKNAVGDILCFLDSDIITPPDYLEKVEKELQQWDALQAKRINLSQPASHLNFNYTDCQKDRDCIPDEAYWEKFLETEDWHLMPYNWKYVCTHSFSMRKELFWKVGGLKRNFIYYGFEDTDLGYRLVRGGYRLKLLDLEVFHMFHENTRSEFMNLSSLRHSLLCRTAQIFYLHHLDEDIYENLRGYMDPEPTLSRLVKSAMQKGRLEFLWKSRPAVFQSIKGCQPHA
ncbi:MAG: glycosyltransferase, partial [Pseudomonadota bacterium]